MRKWLLALGFLPGALYGQESTELDSELFKPTPGNNVFGVKEATLIPHLKLSLEALFHIAQNPLIATPDTVRTTETKIIATQMATDLMASMGIMGFAELGVAIPFALSQSGDEQSVINAGTSISGSAVGDVRLSAKFRLSPSASEKFIVAFAPELSLPTGNGEQLFGAKSASALLTLAASVHRPKLSVSANAGPRFQESVEFLNLELGRSIEGGVGLAYRASDWLTLLGEINGAVSLQDLGIGQSPSEVRFGTRFKIGKNLWLPIGAGLGVTDGVGSPDLRIIAGLSMLPEKETDLDLDGLIGRRDKCPTQAEDKDGFEDQDGCPDDNDQDGVADSDDACAETPGSPAMHGCPDADNDLIADAQDACPTEPGSAEMHGCPDTDGDQITDREDACPSLTGPKEQDGCPDSDHDSIADHKDKCVDSPEDLDDFQDQDGCPDLDNDEDSIADASDQCPNEKEDGKGSAPNDGCPSTPRVIIAGDSIFVMETVYFDIGKASLQKRSYSVLDDVAQLLMDHPEIAKIEVKGHTDDQGNDKSNMSLSARRAERVMEYLIEKGVDPSRVEAQGYGESTPLAPVDGLEKGELRAAREKNRRVEFKIIN